MKKVFAFLMTAVLATVMLSGCGSGSSINGYYIFDRSGGPDYALEISGSKAIIHYAVYGGIELEADVEKTDDGADLYFEASSQVMLQLRQYNPLHAKLSDDGERLYLSSDVSGWSTDTYQKVSKQEFEAFIENW